VRGAELLREFHVRDFALADDIAVTLGGGLNVITGETGSGKSVLVSAISLLLGQKPGANVVRAGCERALVEGVFEWRPPEPLLAELEAAGIEIAGDGELIVSREINASGRPTTRVNARAVPSALLHRLGERLADIHGQYQHQTLLRKSDHTEFLDLLAGEKHLALAGKYVEKRRSLRALLSEKRELDAQSRQRDDERDLLRFRIREIEEAISGEEEFAELEQDARRLEHAAELGRAAEAAWELVCRSGEETSALNRLADATAALDPLEGIETRLDEARARLLEADAIIDEAARTLRSIASDVEADPDRLRAVQDRIIEVRDLMKKNQCDSVSSLIEFRNRSEARLEELEKKETHSDELDEMIEKEKIELTELASRLTSSRRKEAARVGKLMKSGLAALGMKGAEFSASFSKSAGEDGLPGPHGAETAEFMFSANPGEPARPLAEVASGGELSRVMLAFKSLLNRSDPVPVLVFDEIDTGIGGVTANVIGSRLAELGRHHQVIAITHLPQIAAYADTHVTVAKEQRGGRTLMKTGVVRGEERLRELCRMLGDSGVRNPSMKLARQLIEDASRAREAS